MKVIGIISSPKRNGNTATLVRKCLEGAKDSGAEIKEIFLQDYNIKYCKGCFACTTTGKCAISDDFASIRKELIDADGIVLGSPNYGSSINAIMKTFSERLGMFEFMTSSVFGGKYVAGISTTGGSGANKVAKSLVFGAKNGIFKRSFVSGILGVATKGGKVQDNKLALEKAYKLGQKIAEDIKKQKKYYFQNIPGRIINKITLKPIFTKQILKNKESSMKGVYQNLKEKNLLK